MSSIAPTTKDIQIFTPQEWKALYPLAGLRQVKASEGLTLLHYLMAMGLPTKNILEEIPKLKEKNPRHLTEADAAHFGLTPLIIATMLGVKEFAEALLGSWSDQEKATNIEKIDQFGFNALHHAAISSDTIYHMLLQNNANPNALTHKGTAEDLRHLVGKAERESYSLKNVSLEIDECQVIDIARALKQDLGLEYRDEPLYTTAASVKELWQEKAQNWSG